MNKITFNTHRFYTSEGQVITAEVVGENTLFKDHSRLICGEIEGTPGPESIAIRPFAYWVMRHYDAGMYKMNIDAAGLERRDVIHSVRM